MRRVREVVEGRFDEAFATAVSEVADQLEQREQDALVAVSLRAVAALVPLVDDRSPANGALAGVKETFGADMPRSVTAGAARLEGVLATLRGEHGEAADRFGVALAAARSLHYVPRVAEILVDYAASLVSDDRGDEAAPLLAEAREIAEQLRWARLLDRIEKLETSGVPETAVRAPSAPART